MVFAGLGLDAAESELRIRGEKKTVARQQTKQRTTQTTGGAQHLYTLEVFIMSGPLAKSFVQKNRVIARTIQIRGDQTLEDLHHATFAAFDREEEHMYEFQVGGKGPMYSQARRYVLPACDHVIEDESMSAGVVTQTTVGSLGLKVNEAFGYWFDFGDDWWHQINVVAIEGRPTRGKFPKVTKRIGQSPPQYVDWDEEEMY
jgi:Plasmid pRiA4b ORF-3-like protein